MVELGRFGGEPASQSHLKYKSTPRALSLFVLLVTLSSVRLGHQGKMRAARVVYRIS